MKRALLAACAAMTFAAAADAATVFGIDRNNNLVSFNSAAPDNFRSSVAITGASGFQAIDFRPLNNVLYGLGGNNVVYSINRVSGLATAISGPLALSGAAFAFDFNPTIDRIRIVSDTNQNYVVNPNDGALTTATPVFFAGDDPNARRDPNITAVAYTTSTFGAPGTSTQLYAVDSRGELLATQANSAGTLRTVGPFGVDLGSGTSFDILGTDAFVQNGRDFYGVDLASGALTQIGQTDRSLFGIAIAAVPEPGTWAMMILGFGAVGYSLRRRPRARVAHA